MIACVVVAVVGLAGTVVGVGGGSGVAVGNVAVLVAVGTGAGAGSVPHATMASAKTANMNRAALCKTREINRFS